MTVRALYQSAAPPSITSVPASVLCPDCMVRTLLCQLLLITTMDTSNGVHYNTSALSASLLSVTLHIDLASNNAARSLTRTPLICLGDESLGRPMEDIEQRGGLGYLESRTALRIPRIRRQFITGDVDFETKYPFDAYGKELEVNARVWRVYDDEAPPADENEMLGLKTSIDTLLVFAGLFSAVVTTFVAQSSLKLEPDYVQITASLVNEMVLRQRGAGSVPQSQLSYDSETYQMTDIWVNGLWLSSLSLSLLSALLSVLAKQWIQAFESDYELTGYSKDLAIMREYRRQSLRRWRVRSIIGLLPVLLSVALLLFMAGLSVYTMAINTTISFIVIGFASLTFFFYTVCIILPVFVQSCAYKTPLYDLIANVCDPIYARIRAMYDAIAAPAADRKKKARFSPSNYFRTREYRAAHAQEVALAENALVWLCQHSTNNTAISVSLQAVLASLTQLHRREGRGQSAQMRRLELDAMHALKEGKHGLVAEILDSIMNASDPTRHVPADLDVVCVALLMRDRRALEDDPLLLLRPWLPAFCWRRIYAALDRLRLQEPPPLLHPLAWRELELAISYCTTLEEIQPFLSQTARQTLASHLDRHPILTMAGHPVTYGPIHLDTYAKARGWEDGEPLLAPLRALTEAAKNFYNSIKVAEDDQDAEGQHGSGERDGGGTSMQTSRSDPARTVHDGAPAEPLPTTNVVQRNAQRVDAQTAAHGVSDPSGSGAAGGTGGGHGDRPST